MATMHNRTCTLWSPTHVSFAIMLYMHPRGLCRGENSSEHPQARGS